MKFSSSLAQAFAFMAILGLTACGGGGGSGGDRENGLIAVSDKNALTDALVVRFGEKLGQKIEGDLPTKTDTGSEPVITPVAESRAAGNGDTVDIDLKIDSASPLGSLLLKVVGADSFLAINLLEETRNKVSLSERLAIGIPENITDGTFCVEIVAVDEEDRVSEAEQTCFDIESTADDGPVFTETFFNDRAFYISGIEGTALFDGEFIELFQYTFRSDGTATETWRPGEENNFSTTDTYLVEWSIDDEGSLITEDTDDDGRYVLVLTPSAIAEDSANFTWSLTFFDNNGNAQASDSGTGGMTAASPDLYAFLSDRVFDVTVSESDIENWTFNADGTGSVRFSPNPDNDFDANDVTNFQWQALTADRMDYIAFGGDGYDREQTNCEDDPFIDCELNPAEIEVTFTSIATNSASFNLDVRSDDGTFMGSGSMRIPGTEPQARSLVGSWQGIGAEFVGFPHIVTFFPDGDYVMGYVCDSGSGVEYGNYAYNNNTGAFSLSNVTETGPEGGCGLNDEGDGTNVTSARVNDDGELQFSTTDAGTVTFAPADTAQRPSIVGLIASFFETSGAAQVPVFVFAFLADGNYMMMDSTPSSVDPDCAGGGIEFGPYSYNTQTNALEIGTPTVNENGGCGIDDDEADLVLRYLSDDRLGLEDRTSPGDVVEFQKIW